MGSEPPTSACADQCPEPTAWWHRGHRHGGGQGAEEGVATEGRRQTDTRPVGTVTVSRSVSVVHGPELRARGRRGLASSEGEETSHRTWRAGRDVCVTRWPVRMGRGCRQKTVWQEGRRDGCRSVICYQRTRPDGTDGQRVPQTLCHGPLAAVPAGVSARLPGPVPAAPVVQIEFLCADS